MKIRNLVLAAVFLAVPCFGQVYSQMAIQNNPGNWLKAIPGALVYVCNASAANADCLALTNGAPANTYTDQTLTTLAVQPTIADINGNYTLFAQPAIYLQCVKGAVSSFCQLIQIGGNGGAGVVSCPTALNGSLAAFSSTTVLSCDQATGTDFLGHVFFVSGRATGAFNGFIELTGGQADPTNPPDTNSMAFLAPNTVPTPYYFKFPSSVGTVGQCLVISSQVAGSNGTVNTGNWSSTCGSGGVTLQTNTVNNSSQSTLNNSNGLGVTVANPSGGIVTYGIAGATQISTPTAPTVTPNGTPGSTQYCYKIVGWEDPAGLYHTPATSATCTSTGNATLSSSNSITLTAYGDTLYGPRCYAIYRTTSAGTPSSTGLIAGCAGKIFKDSGLAGDSSTAPSTNTTILLPNMSPLPGCNIPGYGAIIGADAPPCSPTATDDENGETFGAPGDTNNPFWQWFNQDTATAVWSSGTIVITTAANAAHNLEGLFEPLPVSTPYTYVAYFDGVDTGGGPESNCGIGFMESSTGKITTFGHVDDQGLNTVSGNGGYIMIVFNFPSATNYAGNSIPKYQGYRGSNGGYFKIQNTGTNIVYSFSPSGDGVAFTQFYSQAVGVPFTTGPNRLVIFGTGTSTSQSVCTFDYVRRTQ